MFQLSVAMKEKSLDKEWYEKNFYLNLSNGEEIGSCDIWARNELMNLHIYDGWKRKGFGKFFLQEIMKDHKFYLRCHKDTVPFYVSCGLLQVNTPGCYFYTFNHGIELT